LPAPQLPQLLAIKGQLTAAEKKLSPPAQRVHCALAYDKKVLTDF
jgi:hypothetical protein